MEYECDNGRLTLKDYVILAVVCSVLLVGGLFLLSKEEGSDTREEALSISLVSAEIGYKGCEAGLTQEEVLSRVHQIWAEESSVMTFSDTQGDETGDTTEAAIQREGI